MILPAVSIRFRRNSSRTTTPPPRCPPPPTTIRSPLTLQITATASRCAWISWNPPNRSGPAAIAGATRTSRRTASAASAAKILTNYEQYLGSQHPHPDAAPGERSALRLYAHLSTPSARSPPFKQCRTGSGDSGTESRRRLPPGASPRSPLTAMASAASATTPTGRT